MKFYRVHIEFMDDRTEVHPYIKEAVVVHNQLHLHKQNGSMAPREHIGSYPLVNIRSWRAEEMQ